MARPGGGATTKPKVPRPAGSPLTGLQSYTNRRIACHWSLSSAGGRGASNIFWSPVPRDQHNTFAATTPLRSECTHTHTCLAGRKLAQSNICDTFVLEPSLTFPLSETDNLVHNFFAKYNNIYLCSVTVNVKENSCCIWNCFSYWPQRSNWFMHCFNQLDLIWNKDHESSPNSEW